MAPPVGIRPSRAGAGKALRVLGVLSGAIVVTAAGFVSARVTAPPCCVSPPAPGPSPLQVRASEIFTEAKGRIREGQWLKARVLLLEVKAFKPDHPGLDDYLAQVEKEIPNQEHLAAARAALAEKKLAVAQTELDRISADTTMYEQVNQLKRQLRDTADSRVREAKALLQAGQREWASGILTDVLAVFPDDRDARDAFLQTQSLPLAESDSPEWDQAVRSFARGDLESAEVLAQTCAPRVPRCKSGLKDLKEFRKLYPKLEDLSAQQLARLVQLDRQITGAPGPSKLCQRVGERMANIDYKRASAAKAAGQWLKAVEYARQALKADPSHTGASSILQEMRNKAKDIYLMAYALKSAAPKDSLRYFREVTAMTTPDDGLHQDAQSWVEVLQPKLELPR